jgi:hypothetical protein
VSEEKKTPESRADAIKARRAERAAAIETARAEQEVADLEAIEALEAERGITLNIENQVAQFVPGCPVIVGVRPPDATEYKRFFQKIGRAGEHADAKMAAHAELAQVCWAYPEDKKLRDGMLAANGGLLATVGNVAIKLAELKKDEAGKG